MFRHPWSVVVFSMLVLPGCERPEVTLVDPGVVADGDRDVDSAHVVLEDAGLAEALGWQRGVPGAAVIVHRVGEPFRPETLWTDTAGMTSLEDIRRGFYRVAAYRGLDEAESGRVGSAASAFGDGFMADRNDLTPRLRSDTAGSVVISEIYPGEPFLREIDYTLSGFVELHNNADTAVYLDGMVYGLLWNIDRELTSYPCAVTAPYRTDPRGVWARFWHQMPGTGQDYSLPPGRTITIARNATDHSQVDARFPDLSDAGFELITGADVDNPDVPNMPEAGIAAWPLEGGGIPMTMVSPHFLALPVEADQLEQATLPNGWRYALIPAERLLDVFVTSRAQPRFDEPNPPCGQTVHTAFDRLEGGFLISGEDLTLSVHRPILRWADGRPVIQDLNVSFLDFEIRPYSPGRVTP